MPVHAAAREGSLDVLQYLYGAGFDMTGGRVGRVALWRVGRQAGGWAGGWLGRVAGCAAGCAAVRCGL